MASPNPTAIAWPAELADAFQRSITCEYSSLTRAGAPITAPITPYPTPAGTIDVSTGLTYPAKAERARRNSKVSLLFADPIGTGADSGPVVLVQGHAAVRDADLQANTDRYVRLSAEKLPETSRGQPKFMLRRLAFYYARIWIEITPVRMRWWPDRELTEAARQWEASPGASLPESDPAPQGRQPPAWIEPPADWRAVATSALSRLPLADLTTVDGEGYPLSIPVSAGVLEGEEVALRIGPGAPELTPGPACLTVHGHDEKFTGQENHTLIGELAQSADGPRLQVSRALPDWSLDGNRAKKAVGFLKKGRQLSPRLQAEAARRGQPVPKVNV